METLKQNFLIHFVSGISSEQREQNFLNDLAVIKKMDDGRRLDFNEKIHYFLQDYTSYAREFAIDSVTFKSVVCNRCASYNNVAKEELLRNVCLSEKISETERSKRFDDFISGYVFFEIENFKTPILKIISGNKMVSIIKIKDLILAIMDSKEVIFIDCFGHLIT